MQTLCIQAKYLWDGTSDELIENGSVLIQNNKVIRSGQLSPADLPEKTETADLGDATIIPGLIDGHTHPV